MEHYFYISSINLIIFTGTLKNAVSEPMKDPIKAIPLECIHCIVGLLLLFSICPSSIFCSNFYLVSLVRKHLELT